MTGRHYHHHSVFVVKRCSLVVGRSGYGVKVESDRGCRCVLGESLQRSMYAPPLNSRKDGAIVLINLTVGRCEDCSIQVIVRGSKMCEGNRNSPNSSALLTG